MARRKSQPEDPTQSPSFEEALAGLEAIVDAMEREQLPLEELVAHYEKGSRLLDRCESILQTARGRIQLITLRNQTEAGCETGTDEPTGTTSPSAPSAASDDDNDDIRLF